MNKQCEVLDTTPGFKYLREQSFSLTNTDGMIFYIKNGNIVGVVPREKKQMCDFSDLQED